MRKWKMGLEIDAPSIVSDALTVAGTKIVGAIGDIYYVDPANGSDSNGGASADDAFASVATAYAACTDANNDVVVFMGGATADSPTAAITWSKSYTHLVGVSTPIAMGQRCRIVNTSTNDLATLFTLSGSGCVVKNIQFYDGKDKAEDGSCVVVSGERNYFENVFVAGMGHATPAARAGSVGMTVSGAENTFRDCTIGLDTIVRGAANTECKVSGARNRFQHCDFRCNSVTAGKFLVTIDNSGGDLRDTIFEDCLFFCYSENWAAGINNVFDMPAGGNTHWVILRNCSLVGTSVGWADVVTRIYTADPAPNAGAGVSTNPTT